MRVPRHYFCMKHIVISASTGEILADGILGEQVTVVEGNYYFDRECVMLDMFVSKKNAYTCPIKKSSCDYYYIPDKNGRVQGKEVCWIYETIENPLFAGIVGKVGMYKRSSHDIVVQELDE
jgi:uncharacterized protein (DUF427 family)